MPSGVGLAIAGATAIGVAGSYFGGKAASEAAGKAADVEWAMYQQSREDYAPWREAGEWALNATKFGMNVGPGEFKPEDQPGYEFGYEHFIKDPYLGAQAAKGKRTSGETMKGLTRYAQDYAETSYDRFLNRYYDKLKPYQSMANLGQSAAGGTAQAGAQAASGMNQAYQAQGSANADMYAGMAGAAQSGLSSYMDYKTA